MMDENKINSPAVQIGFQNINWEAVTDCSDSEKCGPQSFLVGSWIRKD